VVKRALGAARGMKDTARGTGKVSEKGSARPAFLMIVAALAIRAVWRKKVTAEVKVVAGSAAARISVLLARWGDPNRPKRVCPGVVLANLAVSETKE
jgi:hypothetical protein